MNFGRFGKIASVSLIGAMLLAGCSGNGQTVMKIGDTNITEGAVNFKLRNGYRGRRRRS
jgi:PBP1b-binding outer membrane lipoprotein LpoB